MFTGSGEPVSYVADEEDSILIGRASIERLGSIDSVLAHFDAADFTIPPLVIVGS